MKINSESLSFAPKKSSASGLKLFISSSLRKPFWIIIFSGIILFGTALRLVPYFYSHEMKAEQMTNLYVSNLIHRSAVKDIDKEYPNLSQDEKAFLVNVKFKKTLKYPAEDYSQAMIRSYKNFLQGLRTSNPSRYLLGADPYYYLSLTRQLLDQNLSTMELQGRNFLNLKSVAPLGNWYPWDFHAYSGKFIHILLSFFNPNQKLIESVGWVSPFLWFLSFMSLSFVAIKVFRMSLLQSVFSLTLFSCIPIFTKRSLWGWYDTDPYNVLFPCVIFCLMAFSFSDTKIFTRRLIWISLSAFTFFTYSLFWRGWIIVLLTFAAIMFIVSSLLHLRRSKMKLFSHSMALTSLFLAIPLLCTMLFWGTVGLQQEMNYALDFIKGFLSPTFSLWPDLMLTVGELKSTGFHRIMQLIGGGPWIILISFTGLIITALRQKKSQDSTSLFPVLFVLVWMFIAFMIAVKIERFALFTVLPISIGFAFGLSIAGEFCMKLLRFLTKPDIPWNSLMIKNIASILLFIMLTFVCVKQTLAEITTFHPIFNSTWGKSMQYLNHKTPEDSIVSTWWSPGHFITSEGNRRVNWDGSTQDVPQGYWVSNIFMQESEEFALRMLRMINVSGNQAIVYLQQKGFKLSQAIALVRELLKYNRQEAKNIMQSNIPKMSANVLLDLTHPMNQIPHSYLLIYDQMVEQVLALEFAGNWNFKKAEVIQQLTDAYSGKFDHKLLKRGNKINTQMLWKISGQPSPFSKSAYPVYQEGTKLWFGNNVYLNLKTRDVQIDSEEYGRGVPKSVFFFENNKLEKYKTGGGNLNVHVLFIRDHDASSNNIYKAIILSHKWLNSLITKMYYLNGSELRFLTKAFDENSFQNQTSVMIYEVDWDKFMRNEMN